MERADIEKILGEHELGLSGTVSADSAAKIGQLTGAKVLVTGRVFKAEGELFIVAKIIGTETSRVYGELVKTAIRRLCVDVDSGHEFAAGRDAEGVPRLLPMWRRVSNSAARSKRLLRARRCQRYR